MCSRCEPLPSLTPARCSMLLQPPQSQTQVIASKLMEYEFLYTIGRRKSQALALLKVIIGNTPESFHTPPTRP